MAPTQPAYAAISDTEFRQLRDLIQQCTGIALSEHKRALVCSRLARRLRHYQLSTYAEYYTLLMQQDPHGTELIEMVNAITTNKTEFFREAHHFQFLAERILPTLQVGPSRRLRLWSAGSSSGEEAYSLAITIREAGSDGLNANTKILATDIDTRVLAHAESGIYTLEQVGAVAAPLRRRYFHKGIGAQDGYARVKPEVRDMIRFRWLNLIDEAWPIQADFDVIFCRNVLIYFSKPVQQQVLERLSAKLRRGGHLMLGHAESIHGFEDRYRPVGHSIYQVVG